MMFKKINNYATFRYHFFEITQVQRISQVYAATLSNDIAEIVPKFKDFSDKINRKQISQKKQNVI